MRLERGLGCDMKLKVAHFKLAHSRAFVLRA